MGRFDVRKGDRDASRWRVGGAAECQPVAGILDHIFPFALSQQLKTAEGWREGLKAVRMTLNVQTKARAVIRAHKCVDFR